MKFLQPLLTANLLLFVVYTLAFFLFNISNTELKNCFAITVILTLVCVAIIEFLKKNKASEKKRIIHFTAGSTIMTVTFLLLFVLFYLKDIHEYSFTYLILLISGFILMKVFFIRALTLLP